MIAWLLKKLHGAENRRKERLCVVKHGDHVFRWHDEYSERCARCGYTYRVNLRF